MIKIAVLEDEREVLQLICRYLQKGIKDADEVKIYSFLNVNIFKDRLKSGEKFDIVFSDINMGKENGISFGKWVIGKYPQTYFVFITSYPEFAAESYKMEVYQYILKQDMESRIPYVVKNLIEKMKKEKMRYRLVGPETKKEKLFYEDIIYISKMKAAKYVQYVTINKIYRERIALEQLMKELHDEAFVLVERAYIVNMRHIVKISGNMIYLENQDSVVISRARLSQIKEKINLYWKENASWR